MARPKSLNPVLEKCGHGQLDQFPDPYYTDSLQSAKYSVSSMESLQLHNPLRKFHDY